MKIYTKAGDSGQTSDPGGRPMPKNAPVFAVTGGLDELNSWVGLCLAACGQAHARVGEMLRPVQAELLAIGTVVAACSAGNDAPAFDASAVKRMEDQIDSIWSEAGELESFILPGGCELAGRLHVARTACRRAERDLAGWAGTVQALPGVVLSYVNRLSDLLFALSRLANAEAGVGDTPWAGAAGA